MVEDEIADPSATDSSSARSCSIRASKVATRCSRVSGEGWCERRSRALRANSETLAMPRSRQSWRQRSYSSTERRKLIIRLKDSEFIGGQMRANAIVMGPKPVNG